MIEEDDDDIFGESTPVPVRQEPERKERGDYIPLTDDEESSLVSITGKDYLPVVSALDIFCVLYGDTHTLVTECVEYARNATNIVNGIPVTTPGYAIFKASVYRKCGGQQVIERTAHKVWAAKKGSETDYYEKAETGSQGRVLRAMGINARTYKSGLLKRKIEEQQGKQHE